jgi:hypothetical protein
MTRRRFLRATSLTLLILCLAAWGWSYFDSFGVGYELNSSPWLFSVNRGRIAALQLKGWGSDDGSHLRFVRQPAFANAALWGERNLLGFTWFADSTVFQASSPMWFPTLLLAALTWWTWRKPGAKSGRGFAIDSASEASAGNSPEKSVDARP